MSDVQWASYCKEHGEDTYEWCRPVMPVKKYALDAKAAGAKLYVLTTSGTQIETEAKRKFIDRYYPGIFDDIYSVEHDNEKVKFILEKASELGIEPSDCELVEDTYAVAHAVGVGLHVACHTCSEEWDEAVNALRVISAEHVAHVEESLLLYIPVLEALVHCLAPDAGNLCTESHTWCEPLTDGY